jgi:hypothetical protein
MNALLTHLLKTYKISALAEIFNIGQNTWRQHKAYIDNNEKKGQKMPEHHFKSIRGTYKAYLKEKHTEVSDIDFNIY